MKQSNEQALLCHVNLAKEFRGGERQTELLIRELSRRRWRQRLVARRGAPLAERCSGIENLDVVESASNPVAAAFVARGSAIVHAHEARAVYSGWLLSQLRGVPYLLTRRVDNPFKTSFLRDLAYHKADRVVCLSQAIARCVTLEYPTIRPQVVQSANAALANRKHTSDAIRKRFRDKVIVGHVGALVQRHKGQRTILEAARTCAYTNPEFAFLLIGDGEDGQDLRGEAQGLDNVEFTGWVENVGDYLAAFDLFVFPSLHEGLGSSLLDAMSFGLPIVASNVGGIGEIVEDGVNGILIPPDNADALTNALQRLSGDPVMRRSMRDANLLKAANFDASRMAVAYEKIYRSILKA